MEHFHEWYKPCRNAATVPESTARPAPKRARDFVEDVPGVEVPPATRRRMVANLAKDAAAWREKERIARGRAIQACIGMLPASHVAGLRVSDQLTFEPHPSHTIVFCGGFVGCFRCGSVVGHSAVQTLASYCRGHCPTGSRGPVTRLARGRLPHRQQGSPQWPTGELNPSPALCVRSRAAAGAAGGDTPAVQPPELPTASGSRDALPEPPAVTWVPTRTLADDSRIRARRVHRFRM